MNAGLSDQRGFLRIISKESAKIGFIRVHSRPVLILELPRLLKYPAQLHQLSRRQVQLQL